MYFAGLRSASEAKIAAVMRGFFSKLAVFCLLFGILFPPLLMIGVISGVLALMCAPEGLRPDGEERTGGLLGGVWDSWVVNHKMAHCPYCAELIFKEATKCKHCGEWVGPVEGEEEEEDTGDETDERDEAEEADSVPARRPARWWPFVKSRPRASS